MVAAVTTAISPEERPDLYTAHDNGGDRTLRGASLVADTGVAKLIDISRHNYFVDLDEAAAQFAGYLTMTQPRIETWLLTDADVSEGIDVTFGPWRLRSPTHYELVVLAPVAMAHEYLPDRRRINADLYGGSAFLRLSWSSWNLRWRSPA